MSARLAEGKTLPPALSRKGRGRRIPALAGSPSASSRAGRVTADLIGRFLPDLAGRVLATPTLSYKGEGDEHASGLSGPVPFLLVHLRGPP